MSMNLTLSNRGDDFPLRQTPTDLTFKVLNASTDAERVRLYLDWCQSTAQATKWHTPWEVEDYEAHRADLLQWLEDNPNHKWGMI